MEPTEPIESLTQTCEAHHLKAGLSRQLLKQESTERMQMEVGGGHGWHLAA